MSADNEDDPFKSITFGKSLSLRVDGGFNAVSISPSGRDVVLASRQGLYVVDLDDPFSAPRWLHHITPWEVADVQWSPHPSKPSWVVSTSNQKALVWNLSRSSSNAIEHVLHGHSRAITDINFHPTNPEILATCSIDAYVHAWDMRSSRRAFYSASVWSAGAAQVKWNFKNPNVMASAHSNDIFIWDLRKGCMPLHILKGHANSVNSIDFSRFNETEIMSSSNDGTVKFWDYSVNDKEPLRTVVTDFPVSKGRYLPFGRGFCVMPMTGGNNSVYLSSSTTSNDSGPISKFQPIYVFKGHADRVSDFLWRQRHSHDTLIDDREFQLVTWSKDCDLRLWPVNESTYEKVGYERLRALEKPLPDHEYCSFRKEPEAAKLSTAPTARWKENFVTKSGTEASNGSNNINHLAWVSGVRLHHANSPHDLFEEDKLQNLGEEVSMIGHKFPKIVFEKISVSTGILVLTLNGPWSEENPDDYIFLRLEVKFPSGYPQKKHVPRFKIEENRELSEKKHQEIVDQLGEIARRYTDLGKYCLEPCLRFLLGEKINLDGLQEEEQLLNLDLVDHVELDEFSSLASSDARSRALSDVSNTSEDDFDDIDNKSSADGFVTRSTHDLRLDTTPIPKGCGAAWTAAGQLVCFFMVENKVDKKQSFFKLGQRSFGGLKDAHKPELLFEEQDANYDRPKRYVDTLSASSHHNSEGANSLNASDSDASSDSFGDDWNDIAGNDITWRTKMPLISNFKKSLASMASDDNKSSASVQKSKNIVTVRDFSHLIPDKKQLAMDYKLYGDSLESVCKYNAQVAVTHGFEELAHCWRMIANVLMAREEKNPYNFGWDQHSLGGKWFVKQTMIHFEKLRNVQMLAILSCILMDQPLGKTVTAPTGPKKREETIITFESKCIDHSQRSRHESVTSSIRSEDYFNGAHGGKTLKPWTPVPVSSQDNLSSHNMLPDIKIEIVNDEVLDLLTSDSPPLLDAEDEAKYRSYRYQYAELLFYWGLLINRTELLKFNFDNDNFTSSMWPLLNHAPQPGSQLDYMGICYKLLEQKGVGTYFSRNCNYCELRVDGRGSVCGNCQHILHAECAKVWWEVSNECASGCGCACVEFFDVV
ncbi:Maintenance of telomere capping protein 5 [Lachancea thermotolerans]